MKAMVESANDGHGIHKANLTDLRILLGGISYLRSISIERKAAKQLAVQGQ